MIDNKVSYIGDSVKFMIVDNIEGKLWNLSLTTENKHTFLVMDINFIGGKKVSVSKPHKFDMVLNYFGGTLKGKVVKPATSQLFRITSKKKDLDDERKEHYHSITFKT